MALPTISGAFRLIDTPELTFAKSGTPILKVRLAANSFRKNQQTGEWEDADQVFLNGTVFGPRAEAGAEANLSKGQEVLVTGRLKTAQWENAEGEKRSAPELLIDSMGPTIRPPRREGGNGQPRQGGGYGNQGGGFGGQQGNQGAPAQDPWATGGGFGGGNEPAPF